MSKLSVYLNKEETCRQNFSNSVKVLATHFMYTYYKFSWLVSKCIENGFLYVQHNPSEHSASIPLYLLKLEEGNPSGV